MSDKETGAVKTVSRSFDVATEIGEIKGQIGTLETLLDQTRQTVATLDIPTPTMTTKHLVSFSGKSGERVTAFLSKMQNLQTANKWSAEQTVANTILSLRNEAEVWFDEELDKVKTDNKFDFAKLSTELKARFESAFSESDVLSEVLSLKQRPGESVESFLGRIMPKLSLLKMDEALKCGLLSRNFTSKISQELELRGLKQISEVELYAMKLERLYMTHKTSVASVEEEEVAVLRPKQLPRPAQRSMQGQRQKKPVGPCWSCGQMGHFQQGCPLNKGQVGNMPMQNIGSMYSVPTFEVSQWQQRQMANSLKL